MAPDGEGLSQMLQAALGPDGAEVGRPRLQARRLGRAGPDGSPGSSGVVEPPDKERPGDPGGPSGARSLWLRCAAAHSDSRAAGLSIRPSNTWVVPGAGTLQGTGPTRSLLSFARCRTNAINTDVEKRELRPNATGSPVRWVMGRGPLKAAGLAVNGREGLSREREQQEPWPEARGS